MSGLDEKGLEAAAGVLLGSVNAPEQEIYRAARAAIAAYLASATPAEPVAELRTKIHDLMEAHLSAERKGAFIGLHEVRFIKQIQEVAATALERVVRDRDEALADLKSSIEAHHKTSHESVRRIQAIGREKSAVETSLLAAEAKLAEALARLETVEAETRDAFKAGWYTNASYEQPALYLEECEIVDWREYQKKGLDCYVSELIQDYLDNQDNLEPRHD